MPKVFQDQTQCKELSQCFLIYFSYSILVIMYLYKFIRLLLLQGALAPTNGTLIPISSGPTFINDTLIPTSGTSNQDNEIFYQLRSRDIVNLDTRAFTITTPPSQTIIKFGFQSETLISLPKRRKLAK
ncbi:hypothetical protein J1N35_024488 [Gossypium stocksii]|uniref:Uncharacterized protein n=1 Tax=Gossypium stocksii TaxID=47602 RepID=A0A9D3V4Q7_9ROSI|nr:hypothetical protein J1N35_024488 [Gossypium stocksii]